MSVTAVMVKDLRQKSGAGIMECKEALKETDGDMEAALDFLRKKGAAKAAKKADRSTKEGAIAACVDGGKAALVEVKCETDFVARNDTFKAFAEKLAKQTLTCGDVEDDAFLGATFVEDESKTLTEALNEAIHEIGENIVPGRRACLALSGAGGFGLYIHSDASVGVLVELGCEKEESANAEAFIALAKDLAMQAAAMKPIAVDSSGVPEETVARERDIAETQAKESGKPEKIIPNIVEGKIKAFYKEVCLLDQSFVKEQKTNIRSLVASVGKELGDTLTVRQFVRYELGE